MEDWFLVLLLVVAAVSAEAARWGSKALSFPKLKIVLINLSLTALMLSVLLLAGEVYLRFFYDETNSFGLTKTSKLWFERHYRYNAVGIRDSISNSVKRLPGRERVTFVGDSFTAGHGIKDVELRFANRLRVLRPNLEIQVLAKNGLDTGGEIELFESFADRGFEFGKVVLAYCLNDVSDLVPEWGNTLNRIYNPPSRTFFFEASFLGDFLFYQWSSSHEVDVQNYYHVVLKHYEGETWEKQKARLATFKKTVEKHGGVLSVVTFPFFHALGTHYAYEEVHDKLNNAWKELGVANLDLLPIYRAKKANDLTVSARDAHPNELAHQLAADEIAKFLETH